MKVLFVCMGNICRSPTAKGVLRAKAEAAGLIAAHRRDACQA
jgi:protein-tyrosine phosphatase